MVVLSIYNPRQHFQFPLDRGSLELGTSIRLAGRQLELQDGQLDDFRCRVLIDFENEKIELINAGQTLLLAGGRNLDRGQSAELSLPVRFVAGETYFQIDAQHVSVLDSTVNSIAGGVRNSANHSLASPGPATLHAWLDTLSRMQTSVAVSQEFFEEAAGSLLTPGGLDGGIVLKKSESGWVVAASRLLSPEDEIGFNEHLVHRCCQQRATLFVDHSEETPAIIASPVLDEFQQVVAVIYGFRIRNRQNQRGRIRPLEAQFVQVIAHSVSSAWIRFEREAEAARTRVLLENVFSPKVARELEANPQFLNAQSREVTVLFADLRGFTRISEALGTHRTYEMLSDIMDSFSEIVMDREGLVIDFYGDGLSAFWNAPFPQHNHALLACQAAIEMLNRVPDLNARWRQETGIPIAIGIGVHTGIAQVGNSGSRSRIKYGPRGTTVNLASRLESATKEIGVPLLVSADVATRITDDFQVRRICKTRLQGIQSETDIYEVLNPVEANRKSSLVRDYELALKQYEQGQTEAAINSLSILVSRYPGDSATSFLLREAIELREELAEGMQRIGEYRLVAIRNKTATSRQPIIHPTNEAAQK